MKSRGSILLVFLIFGGMFSSTIHARGQSGDPMDLVRKNILNQYLKKNQLDQQVSKWMQAMEEDGSFPDIDYADRSVAVWPPGKHMERLREMAFGYIRKEGIFYQDPTLRTQIEKAINYWLDLPDPPESDNWYFGSITLPLHIGHILLCMQEAKTPLPEKTERGLLAWMEKSETIQHASKISLTRTLGVGLHHIIRGCVTDDPALVRSASEHVGQMLNPENGFTGIRPDYSFHAHGAQLHIHAYGTVFLQRVTQFAEILVGTPYALNGEHLQPIHQFVRNAWLKVARGAYIDFNVFGRQVARPDNGSAVRCLPLAETLRDLDLPDHRSQYEAAIARFSGLKPADYQIQPEHLQFWSSDYHAHIRPEFFAGLRMVSTRTIKAEKGNGENLLEHFRTDGAMSILVKGDEYHEIFPVWKWNQIPGTTAPALDDYAGHKDWAGNRGQTDFVGGVSDGVYGAATYTMDDYDTQAKKSWFFFDKQIVCLGAGINSNSSYPVYSNLNQSLSKGGVKVQTQTGIQHLDKEGTWSDMQVLAVQHDWVGYSFPGGEQVQISNRIQTGSWRRINTSGAVDTLQKKVFTLHIDHGVKPKGDQYAYIVWPAIATLADIQPDQLHILSNTENLQAVYHEPSGILQAVFHEAGSLNLTQGKLKVDEGCVLLIKKRPGQSPAVFVADPTQQLSQIEVEWEDDELGKQQWAVALPGGGLAGKSVQVQ